MDAEALFDFAMMVGMVVFVFLVARAIVLWYWRINRIVELLELQWQQSKSLAVKITKLNKQIETVEDGLGQIVALLAERAEHLAPEDWQERGP